MPSNLKQELKGLINTPFMPFGMYSQDCRDERHHGRCLNCECWCHMQAKLDRIKALLAGGGHAPAEATLDEIASIVNGGQ
jgi:hypothetical protein